jgi:hypothetical protein
MIEIKNDFFMTRILITSTINSQDVTLEFLTNTCNNLINTRVAAFDGATSYGWWLHYDLSVNNIDVQDELERIGNLIRDAGFNRAINEPTCLVFIEIPDNDVHHDLYLSFHYHNRPPNIEFLGPLNDE